MDGTAPQLSLFPPEDTFPEVERPGRPPGFSVRESARARRLSIKVFPRGKVEVVVPRRTRPSDVEAFVRENAAWINKARESFAAEHVPEPFRLPQIIALPAIGKTITVRYVPKKRVRNVSYRLSGNCLTLTGRVSDDKLCVGAIRRWLAGTGRDEFGPRLALLSEQTGLGFRKMQVRAQRTCWGSHSSRGTISLNLCLLFLRPPLMRYLMIHELCHSRHMNHSKRFWTLVGRFEPRYRALDRELTECWKSVPSWLGIY